MVWNIPRMWEGGECWVIGGGPSMPRQFGVPEDVIKAVKFDGVPLSTYSPYLSPIHGKHVIGVNAAFLLGSWIDIAFFGDGGFYFANVEAFNRFPNLRVTCNPNIQQKAVIGVKYVHRDPRHPDGLSVRPGMVSWNKNSGACAINLATQLGAKRVFLLGFDMSLDGNDSQHWHAHYSTALKWKQNKKYKLPFGIHLKCFPMVLNDANRLGIEIINVNPDSAIQEFKKVTLDEALNWGK